MSSLLDRARPPAVSPPPNPHIQGPSFHTSGAGELTTLETACSAAGQLVSGSSTSFGAISYFFWMFLLVASGLAFRGVGGGWGRGPAQLRPHPRGDLGDHGGCFPDRVNGEPPSGSYLLVVQLLGPSAGLGPPGGQTTARYQVGLQASGRG